MLIFLVLFLVDFFFMEHILHFQSGMSVVSGCSCDSSSKTSGSLSSFSSTRLVFLVKILYTKKRMFATLIWFSLSFFWSIIALMCLLTVSLIFNASSWVILPFSIFSVSLDIFPKKIILPYPVGLACKLFLLALKTLFFIRSNFLFIHFYTTW